MFVRARTPGVKNDEDSKLKATVLTPSITQTATPAQKPTETQGIMREKRRAPICHYYNKRGHIRPRCYQYLVDFRKANQ